MILPWGRPEKRNRLSDTKEATASASSLQRTCGTVCRTGLMADDKLQLSLREIERTYLNTNCREYELTKSFSLRLHFPTAFLSLKSQGWREVDIPKWMFDLG